MDSSNHNSNDSFTGFSLYSVLLEIIVKNYPKFKNSFLEFRELKSSNSADKSKLTSVDYLQFRYDLHTLENIYQEYEIILLIITTAFFESYINYYCKRKLGSKKCKELDRLTLESKWKFIPSLVSSKEIETSNHWFELFKKIITIRNRFVHSKGSVISTDSYDQYIKEMQDKIYSEQKFDEEAACVTLEIPKIIHGVISLLVDVDESEDIQLGMIDNILSRI